MSQFRLPLHDAIAQEILAYLAQNPQAADSADGIAQWWLTPPTNQCDPSDVLRTLETLVAQGHIAKVTHREGPVLYRSIDATSGQFPAYKP
jgi:Fe2+ or Zn2+ uptake regulation protein